MASAARAGIADDPRRHRPAHGRRRAVELGRPCCATPASSASRSRSCELSYRVPDDFLRLAATVRRRARACRAACATRRGRPSRSRPTPPALGAGRRRARRAHERRRGQRRRRRRRRRLDAVRAALAARSTTPTPTAAPLGPGVNLLDLHVVKGLEFDAVVVVEPAAILAERPDGGRAACTPRSPARPARWRSSTPARSRGARDRPGAAARGRRRGSGGEAAWALPEVGEVLAGDRRPVARARTRATRGRPRGVFEERQMPDVVIPGGSCRRADLEDVLGHGGPTGSRPERPCVTSTGTDRPARTSLGIDLAREQRRPAPPPAPRVPIQRPAPVLGGRVAGPGRRRRNRTIAALEVGRSARARGTRVGPASRARCSRSRGCAWTAPPDQLEAGDPSSPYART